MVDINIHVRASGPMFEGDSEGIMHRYLEDVVGRLGEEAVNRIRAYLPTQYMYLGHNGGDPVHNPVPSDAGALAASIQTDRQSPEMVQVLGDRVSYGSWIEGDSTLNAVMWPGRVRRGLPARFPGYHAFRLITQELNAEAADIAESMLPPYLAALNA